MKCKHCNAPVTVEDEFCPYCGALNEPARKHIESMRKYSADYERTKEEVMANTRRQSRLHTRIITIALLIVLNIVTITCCINSYEIKDALQSRQIHKHANEHRQKMAAYEVNRDYRYLNAYYSRKYLYSEKSLREYSGVSDMSLNYVTICDNIYYLLSGAQSYSSTGDQLERIAKNLGYFYNVFNDSESSYAPERFSPEHMKAMQDMEANLRTMLKAYCNLTDEDIDALQETDDVGRTMLIGRRMGIYE